MELSISDAVRQKLMTKHVVSEAEVKQAFENIVAGTLFDTREEHRTDPPTQWFIAKTNRGRTLKVCFVFNEGVFFIKTAYEANATEIQIYNSMQGLK